jgi:hypothetical protein
MSRPDARLNDWAGTDLTGPLGEAANFGAPSPATHAPSWASSPMAVRTACLVFGERALGQQPDRRGHFGLHEVPAGGTGDEIVGPPQLDNPVLDRAHQSLADPPSGIQHDYLQASDLMLAAIALLALVGRAAGIK